MDWQTLLRTLYDAPERRLRFLEPATAGELAELERTVGPICERLRELLAQSNGVLIQQEFERGWDDVEWLVWRCDEIVSRTGVNRELMTEDEEYDPGTSVFFSNAGLSSVAFGCRFDGEVWLWGPISGEWKRSCRSLEEFFRRDAAGTIFGSA